MCPNPLNWQTNDRDDTVLTVATLRKLQGAGSQLQVSIASCSYSQREGSRYWQVRSLALAVIDYAGLANMLASAMPYTVHRSSRAARLPAQATPHRGLTQRRLKPHAPTPCLTYHQDVHATDWKEQ